jgi:hypothetical protein
MEYVAGYEPVWGRSPCGTGRSCPSPDSRPGGYSSLRK